MKSVYQFSWTLVSWNLPFDTKEAKRQARRVKRAILSRAARCSIWGTARRGCALLMGGEEQARALIGEVPGDGEVRFLGLTDKQFEFQRVFWGKRRPCAAR